MIFLVIVNTLNTYRTRINFFLINFSINLKKKTELGESNIHKQQRQCTVMYCTKYLKSRHVQPYSFEYSCA